MGLNENNLLQILSEKYENVVEFYVLTWGEGLMEGPTRWPGQADEVSIRDNVKIDDFSQKIGLTGFLK